MKNARFFSHTLFRIGLAALAAATALSMTACKKGGDASGTGSTTTEPTTTTTAAETTTAAPTTTTVPVTGDLTTGWCNAPTMHIRSGPGTDYQAIGGLKNGEQVTILGREGDWYKISFAKGPGGVGYVNAQYISGTVVTTTAPVPTTTAAGTTAAQ